MVLRMGWMVEQDQRDTKNYSESNHAPTIQRNGMSLKITRHPLTVVEELATHGSVVAGLGEVGGDGA